MRYVLSAVLALAFGGAASACDPQFPPPLVTNVTQSYYSVGPRIVETRFVDPRFGYYDPRLEVLRVRPSVTVIGGGGVNVRFVPYWR